MGGMRTTETHAGRVVTGDVERSWAAVMVARKALSVAAASLVDPCFSAPALLAERVGRVGECHRRLVAADALYHELCATERAA